MINQFIYTTLASVSILAVFVFIMTDKGVKKSLISAILTYSFFLLLTACNII